MYLFAYRWTGISQIEAKQTTNEWAQQDQQQEIEEQPQVLVNPAEWQQQIFSNSSMQFWRKIESWTANQN